MAKRDRNERDQGFEESLTISASEVTEPGLIPTGPWVLRCVGASARDCENRDGDEQVCITNRYEAFEPLPDVDPELIEQGGYEGKQIFVQRYLPKPLSLAAKNGTLSRYLKFATLHGLDLEGVDVITRGEISKEFLKLFNGSTVLASVGTRNYENKAGEDITDNNAADFASVNAD